MVIPTAYGAPQIHFSLAEQETGTLWHDGKMIYQKTVDLGALPNTGTKSVAHGVSSLDTIVGMKGAAQNGVIGMNLPNVNTAVFLAQVSIFWNTTELDIVTGSDRSGFDGHLTLYYTKT